MLTLPCSAEKGALLVHLGTGGWIKERVETLLFAQAVAVVDSHQEIQDDSFGAS